MSRTPNFAPRTALESLETRRLLSTYYVSDDPGASDAGDGLSPATAWRSTARVNAASFAAGDTILLEAGVTFAGGLRFGPDDLGSAAAPITVSSYGDGRATIAAGAGDGLFAQNTAGLDVRDLNFVGQSRTTNTGSGVRFDNNLAGDTKLAHVVVDSVDVSAFGKFGVTVGGSRGKSGFRDVLITRVNAYDNATGGIETHGVFSATSTAYANLNVTVSHSKVHDNPGYAKSTAHVGDGIVLSDVDGALIERNVAWNNGALNTHVGGPVGIWVWDANAAVIQYNESHHNRTGGTADGGGFDLDGGVTNSVMQYNYSHDNDGAGYGVFQFSGARPMRNNVVRYNVSQNDGRRNNYAGIQLWNGGSGVHGVEIYNNTVFTSPAAGATPRGLYVQNTVNDVRVRNNVFQTAGGARVVDVQGKQSSFLMQGNAYWSSGGAFAMKYGAKTYTSLAAFRTGAKQETLAGRAVGLQVDPKLTNPGGGGTIGDATQLHTLTAYTLQASSPLRNAALNLFSTFAIDPGREDFFGNPLPDTATASTWSYDIGAHEYA